MSTTHPHLGRNSNGHVIVMDCETAFCELSDLCKSNPKIKQLFEELVAEVTPLDNPDAGADDPMWDKVRAVVRTYRVKARGREAIHLMETFIYLYFKLGVDIEEITQAGRD